MPNNLTDTRERFDLAVEQLQEIISRFYPLLVLAPLAICIFIRVTWQWDVNLLLILWFVGQIIAIIQVIKIGIRRHSFKKVFRADAAKPDKIRIAEDITANLVMNKTLLEFYKPLKEVTYPQTDAKGNKLEPFIDYAEQRQALKNAMVITPLPDDEGAYTHDHFVVMLMTYDQPAKKVEALGDSIKSSENLYSIEVDDDPFGGSVSFICHKTKPVVFDPLLAQTFSDEWFDEYRRGGNE